MSDQGVTDLPVEVTSMIGVSQYPETATFDAEYSYAFNTLAATQNANALYWDADVAAELTNGRRISGYENALAPSTDFAVSPGITASQVSARVNSPRMPATASHANTPAPERKPKSRAATTTTATDIAMAASEVSTCAHSTLDRAIGIDWKRSKIPLCMSKNSRNAV